MAAANSARKIVLPKDMLVAPLLSNVSNSLSEKPPSGPIRTLFSFLSSVFISFPYAARSSAKAISAKSILLKLMGANN